MPGVCERRCGGGVMARHRRHGGIPLAPNEVQVRRRAHQVVAGDRVRWSYEGQHHWSSPVLCTEELPESGKIRLHLPYGFTMIYRRRDWVHIRRHMPPQEPANA